jgi:hypothetical protein
MKILGSLALLVLFVYLILLMFKKIPRINKVILLIAIISLHLGVVIVWYESGKHALYEQIKQWPRLDARVVDIKLEGKRAVQPILFYEYKVGDSTYMGETDLGTPPFGARNKRTLTAQVVLEENPVGSALTIAYNPEKPVQSVTQFHPPWHYYGRLAFGSTLFGLSLLLLLFKLPLRTN